MPSFEMHRYCSGHWGSGLIGLGLEGDALALNMAVEGRCDVGRQCRSVGMENA